MLAALALLAEIVILTVPDVGLGWKFWYVLRLLRLMRVVRMLKVSNSHRTAAKAYMASAFKLMYYKPLNSVGHGLGNPQSRTTAVVFIVH